MLMGNFDINPPGRPIRPWFVLYLTPKGYHRLTRDSRFERVAELKSKTGNESISLHVQPQKDYLTLTAKTAKSVFSSSTL